MPGPIDEGVLDERLAALEGARPWSPRVVAKLEGLIRGGGDADLFRINPYRFAAEKGVAEGEAVDLLLHAAARNLVVMDWLLICPGCSSAVESFRSLHTVHNAFHCTFCDATWQTTLDDFIAVAFTVSSDVRGIAFHHPESLSPADYCFRYVMNREGVLPDSRTPFAEMLRKITPALSYLPAKAATDMEVEAREGVVLTGWSVETDARLKYGVAGPAVAAAQVVPVRFAAGTCKPAEGTVAPGRVVFRVENTTNWRGLLGISAIPADFVRRPLDFTPYLSGKRLVTTQTFRDLFRAEVVGGSEGIGVRDITLLFTDLKGSTALYDRIGDLNAFALVQRHFERLREVTAAHGGAVVKTIGDAVMATFADAPGAVAAALEMQAAVETFNRDAAARDLVLKIGIHKGAAIAVTLNDRLDYFGQTVNIAARVQGLADADEIYLSGDVHDAPGVAELLAPLPVERRLARLRGVGQEVAVYRLAPAARG